MGWRSSLAIAQPATVLTWHRQGFQLYRPWKSRWNRVGRPPLDAEIRAKVMNLNWGMPVRKDGFLLWLGELPLNTEHWAARHPVHSWANHTQKPRWTPKTAHYVGHYIMAVMSSTGLC